jgi:hypothetical protein
MLMKMRLCAGPFGTSRSDGAGTTFVERGAEAWHDDSQNAESLPVRAGFFFFTL